MEFIELAKYIGGYSLSTVWLTVGIWTIFSIVIVAFLQLKSNLHSFFHYHIRLALLLSLPAGILGSMFINSQERFSAVDSYTSYFLIVEHPILATSSSQASGYELSDPLLLIGFLGLLLLGGCILGIDLMVWKFIKLKKFSAGLQKTYLCTIDSVADYNKEFASTLNKKPVVAFSAQSNIPFTFGWKDPTIVIPKKFNIDTSKLNMAIRHELTHIRRHDYIKNMFLVGIKILFWFHPLVHYLYTSSKDYQEILCDQEVLRGSPISKKSYAYLLLDLACNKKVPTHPAIAMSVHSSTIIKRIHTMKNQSLSSKKRIRSILLTSLFALFFTGGMACTDLQETDNNTNSQTPPPPVKSEETNSEISNETEPPPAPFYRTADEMPEIKGGLKSLQQEINYPEDAIEQELEGTVSVQFIVTREGKVENAEVLKGPGDSLNKEALRVVKNQEFEPGSHEGKTVRVQMTLPIHFQL